MSTILLNNKEKPFLQPAVGLWSLYDPENAPYAFRATNLEQAQAWQSKTRLALRRAVGFEHLPYTDLNPELIEEVDKGDYVRQKWLISTWESALMPLYILIPKGSSGPHPAVVAFHGHGYGVKDIVGLWEDGNERETPGDYHYDFGVALVRQGFLVAAPEISCFGERVNDYSHLNTLIGQEVPYTCTHTAMLAFTLGGSVVGLRVHDGMRLLDYLATRGDVDMNRVGAMGISGGGMHTFFSTCLDERIRACVISGYYSTFRDSILAMHHCACNFVPGLAQFGEMTDLVGLIAPRPLLVESGSYDPIFPHEAVVKSVEIARQRVYRAFGAEEKVETDYFEGRHRINGVKAYAFLKRVLQG